MTNADWTTLWDAVRILATPLAAFIAYFIRQIWLQNKESNEKIEKTNQLLGEQNGRISKLETRISDHAAEDYRQFDALGRILDKMEAREGALADLRAYSRPSRSRRR